MESIENCKESLILFISKQIEENSLELKTSTFDFFVDNSSEEGKTLIDFKLQNKSISNELIKQSLSKAINENLLIRFFISSIYSDLKKIKTNEVLNSTVSELEILLKKIRFK